MTALTDPAGAPAGPSRRCPGCPTRVPITEEWCDLCWLRLPFAYQQPVQIAWRRDEQAYRAAVHTARQWLKANGGDETTQEPPTTLTEQLQDAHDLIAGTGRHAGHERTQGGDWVGCSCGATTRGRLP